MNECEVFLCGSFTGMILIRLIDSVIKMVITAFNEAMERISDGRDL